MSTDNTGSKQSVILIVDDMSKNIEIVSIMLEIEGIASIPAESGAEALAILETLKPDLILLDVSMPEMDGYEVCRHIKEIPRLADVPVIFVTAHRDPQDIIKGLAVGAVDYITKPFNRGELLSRINIHLRLKNAMDTIQRQNEQLMQLNKTKDQIFAIIGHDLRAPVGSFGAIIDVLLNMQEMNDASSQELLLLLKNTAANSYNLLDNLLMWAKSQRNELVVNKTIFELQEAVKQTLALLKYDAERKNITIRNLNSNKLNIFSDYTFIFTIYRNLVRNAIKFCNEGGLINISYLVHDNHFITITIADNGIGIPPENIKKIFEPNEIISTFGTNSEKGSGLGLKICRDFADTLGGDIWVESVLNEGSTFFVKIPIK